MQYLFDKIIIDVNGFVINIDEWKKDMFQKWLLKFLTFCKSNKINIFLISTKKDARKILVNEIAEDIESLAKIQIFDENNFQNSWDVWRLENNLNKDNSIVGTTSSEFTNFFKSKNLFTFFLNSFNSENDIEKIANKTSYKKVIEIFSLIEELPNILFKFDSFLENKD